jgi:hypothetical protein
MNAFATPLKNHGTGSHIPATTPAGATVRWTRSISAMYIVFPCTGLVRRTDHDFLVSHLHSFFDSFFRQEQRQRYVRLDFLFEKLNCQSFGLIHFSPRDAAYENA